MKIIKQSFEILPERADPVKQLAMRSRICYKSEDKAKEDERPFLKRIWKHEPIFEMAVVTLRIEYDKQMFTELNSGKYLHISNFKSKGVIIATGSIRAWQEFIKTRPAWCTQYIAYPLHKYNSFLFEEDVAEPDFPDVVEVVDSNTEPTLNNNNYKLHKHVAVKFVTNRAVSQELVRHRPCAFLQESQRYCKYNDEVVFIDPRPAFTAIDIDQWLAAMDYSEERYLGLLRSGTSPQGARTVLPNSCKTEIIVYCNLKEWEHIFNRRTSLAAEPSMREVMLPLHEEFKGLYPDHFNGDPKLSVG